jgi:hypothetical protein
MGLLRAAVVIIAAVPDRGGRAKVGRLEQRCQIAGVKGGLVLCRDQTAEGAA